MNDSNCEDQAESSHARRKGASPSHKKPHNHRHGLLILLLVGLVVIAGGWWWLSTQDHRQAAKPVANHSTSSRRQLASSSQPAKTQASSSVKPAPALPEAEIRKATQQTIGQIAGEHSVYVAKIGTEGTYAENVHAQRAASTIKIFIMITVFERLAAGNLNLDDVYTVREADKVGGSGVMQQFAAGTAVPLRQVMQYMMSDSDNLASNVMIDAVGGGVTLKSETVNLV